MQSLLAEQPLILSIILGILAAGTLYGWLQSGKKELAAVGLICAALIPAAYALAEYWETDREVIESLIYETADAIKSNDHQRALNLLADTALRNRAQMELRNFEFDEARVTKIRQIELIDGTFPQEADVDMIVKFVVSQRNSGFQNQSGARRLKLRMQRSGERWVITDYDHMSPLGERDAFSPDGNHRTFGDRR